MFLSSILNQPFITRGEFFYEKLLSKLPLYGQGIWSLTVSEYDEMLFNDLWLNGEGRRIVFGPTAHIQHSFVFPDNSSVWCSNKIGWQYTLRSSRNFCDQKDW